MTDPATASSWKVSMALLLVILFVPLILHSLPRTMRQWLAVRAIYGELPWSLARQVLGYANRSRMRVVVQLAAFCVPLGLGMILGHIARGDPWQYTAASGAAVAYFLLKLAELSVPPSVLLLSSSSTVSARILGQLNRDLPRFRTVALLQPRERLARDEVKDFFYNSLRTRKLCEWRSIVYHLMDVVPIILVDGESGTDGVREEMVRIERRGYRDRAACITDGHASAPRAGWNLVPRRDISSWVSTRLRTSSDRAGRAARQKEFEAMLAALPVPLRDPQRVEAMVVKARLLQRFGVQQFLQHCKGIGPDQEEVQLLESMPSLVSRDAEIRWLRESRVFEEVEILLRGALDDVRGAPDPNTEFNIGNSLNSLGTLARLRCNWAEAERFHLAAIARLEPRTHVPADAFPSMQELAVAHLSLAQVYMARFWDEHDLQDRERAEGFLHKSIELEQKVGGTPDRARRLLQQLELTRRPTETDADGQAGPRYEGI